MRCDDRLRMRIGQLRDGELAQAERAEVEAHIADCPDCARYRNELAWLGRRISQTREPASPALMQRIRASLEVEAADTSPARVKETVFALILRHVTSLLRAYSKPAFAVLAASLLSVALTLWWAQRVENRDALAHDVLAAHVRSLLQDNTIQVASLDTHTVKPWFNGRIDYTPVVKDLAADGFKLIGGRLDYVNGRRVAALVYMHRLHKISLFSWPADGDAKMATKLRLDGYNIVTWTADNMTFWAISDVEDSELDRLPGLI